MIRDDCGTLRTGVAPVGGGPARLGVQDQVSRSPVPLGGLVLLDDGGRRGVLGGARRIAALTGLALSLAQVAQVGGTALVAGQLRRRGSGPSRPRPWSRCSRHARHAGRMPTR